MFPTLAVLVTVLPSIMPSPLTVCPCCQQGGSYSLSSDISFGWSATFSGSCSGTSTPVCAAACAGITSTNAEHCGLTPCGYAVSQGGSTSASASPDDCVGGAFSSASASAGGTCSGGTLATTVTSGARYLEHWDRPVPNCDCVYDGSSLGVYVAAASAAMICDLAGCTIASFTPTYSINVNCSYADESTTCCTSFGPSSVAAGRIGQDVGVELTGHYSDSSVQVARLQGVYAFDAGGSSASVLQLGVLDDPAVDVSVDGTTATLYASDASLPFDLPLEPTTGVHLVSVSAAITTETFSTIGSDFTPSANDYDRTCWADRRLFVAALGSSIGDGVYRAKFDYDLDGDVDSTDLSAYCSLFNARACPGDYNCSGTISVQDIFDYLTDYFNADPVADFNCSGSVTIQDYFDFITAYFAGC